MEFETISSINQFGNFLTDLQECTELALDIETDSLDEFSGNLKLIQVNANNHIYIFDVVSLGQNYTNYLVALIKDSNRLVVGHNLKFDIKFLLEKTGELLTNIYDTMLAEIILFNGIGGKFYSLADLTQKYCGIELDKSVREEFYNGDGIITYEMLIYSALDVKHLFEIKEKQLADAREKKLVQIFDLEMKLSPVIASMEHEGVLLDKDMWLALMKEAEENAKRLSQQILEDVIEKIFSTKKFKNALEAVDALLIPAKTKKLRNELEGITELEFVKEYIKNNINLNSPRQLLNVLNKIYAINVPDTNEKTINKVRNTDPIIDLIIEYRGETKKGSSFGDSFIRKIHPITGRIHSEFNQLGTNSGRISSDEPNLQNIIADSKYRDCFIARFGKKIVGVDYSQQELRMTARYSGDPNMTQAFLDKIDLHLATAGLLFGKAIEEIDKNERKVGKTLNFAVGYGSSEYGLYKNFGIPIIDGKEYLEKFYNVAYPVLRDWKKIATDIIWERGYSVTAYGRKRWFTKPTIYRDGKEFLKLKSAVGREGVNHIIQGTSADCTKLAMIEIFYNNPFGEKLRLIIQVHDEIVAEVDETIAQEAYAFMCECMVKIEQTFLKHIPAEVDGYVKDHWSK